MVLSKIEPNFLNGRAPPCHARQATRARAQAQFEAQNQPPTQEFDGLLDASVAAMYMAPVQATALALGRAPVAPSFAVPGSYQVVRPRAVLTTSSGRPPLPTPREVPLGTPLSDWVPQNNSDRRRQAEHAIRIGARAPTPNETRAPHAAHVPESDPELFSSRVETAARLAEARRLATAVEIDVHIYGRPRRGGVKSRGRCAGTR